MIHDDPVGVGCAKRTEAQTVGVYALHRTLRILINRPEVDCASRAIQAMLHIVKCCMISVVGVSLSSACPGEKRQRRGHAPKREDRPDSTRDGCRGSLSGHLIKQIAIVTWNRERLQGAGDEDKEEGKEEDGEVSSTVLCDWLSRQPSVNTTRKRGEMP